MPQGTRPYIGGQAVLEGVMMRSPTSFSVVVRRRDGSLHVRERGMADSRKGLAKLPLVRGVASLVESLKLGSEALRFSAEQMERDLEAEEAAEKAAAAKKSGVIGGVASLCSALGYALFVLFSSDADTGGPVKGAPTASTSDEAARDDADILPPEPARKEASASSKVGMTLMLVLMIGFLIALPQAAAAGVDRLFGLDLPVQSPAFQAITGAFKLMIVIGYLLLIRRALPDIRRVFQYHGAEHKTISTYEAGEALTVEHARAKTTLHPRCGTTFLVMVALVSILVFTAIGAFLPKIHTGNAVLDNVVFFLEKLPFLPLLAAVTFEIQRVFARYCTTGPLRVLLWPGFMCQKITTIEPTDDQLEIALASLRVTLFREEAPEAAASGPEAPADVRYATFGALMGSPKLHRAA